jgi:hypothetical protein
MTKAIIDQNEIDELLAISDFIEQKGKNNNEHSLIEEIKSAILDSGKLSLREWNSLRKKLNEIEEVIPHIDLIIRLKEQKAMIDKAQTQF